MDPSKKYEDKFSDSSGVYKSRNSASPELSNPYLTFSTCGPPPPSVIVLPQAMATCRDLGAPLDHSETDCPPSATCYSPQRLGHDAYSELCLVPAVAEKQKFHWFCHYCCRPGGVYPSLAGQLPVLAGCTCFFFLASVFSPCSQKHYSQSTLDADVMPSRSSYPW